MWLDKEKGVFKVIDKGKTLELWNEQKVKQVKGWNNFVYNFYRFRSLCSCYSKLVFQDFVEASLQEEEWICYRSSGAGKAPVSLAVFPGVPRKKLTFPLLVVIVP